MVETQELREKIEKFTEVQCSLFNYMLLETQSHKTLYQSQEYIAKKLGMTRQYCNRTLRLCVDAGILLSEYRHYRTCVYTIAPIIYVDGIKHILMKYFKALRRLPIFLPLILLFSGSFTQRYYGYKGINNRIKVRSNMQGDNPIPQAVRDLKCFTLSRAGQIKLSGMPAEALVFAENQMQYAKNIRDQFSWFFKLAKEYCYREELTIDWALVDTLKAKYAIKNDAPMLLPQRPFDKAQDRNGSLRLSGPSGSASYAGHGLKKTYVKQPYRAVVQQLETRLERDATEMRLKDAGSLVTQRHQFKKWTRQIGGNSENTEFVHALRHMIANLDLIPIEMKIAFLCVQCSMKKKET